jgi:hypothetical protein
LVVVAVVRRLLPRHWDGHRLLQFLTGLALLALTFGGSAVPATPVPAAPAPVTTTVEAPAETAAKPAVHGVQSPAGRTADPSDECQHDASQARVVQPVDDAAALAGATQRAHGSRAPPLG